MSDTRFEQRKMSAWHDYTARGGKMNFETFYGLEVTDCEILALLGA
jgi:hypothetical protein